MRTTLETASGRSGSVALDASDDAAQLLFNTTAFHQMNVSDGQRITVVHGWDGERFVGSLSGVTDGDSFCSGHSAPFGGPDFVDPHERVGTVIDMLRGALAELAGAGVREVRVRARPLIYAPVEAHVHFALSHLGFAVEGCELNYALDLRRWDDAEHYAQDLGRTERKKLRRAAGEPFTLTDAGEDEDLWATGYDVLARNRRAKGRPLRLPLEYLLRARATFPGRIAMLVLFHEEVPCGAAVVYRVLADVDVVVYWGDVPTDTLETSPMVPLAVRVVERSFVSGARILDLGIASENGVPNHGLAYFKERLLARPEPRFTFVGTLPLRTNA